MSYWKYKYWHILDLFKLVIMISMIVCNILSKEIERDRLFMVGWAPIILIFGYVIVMAICAARDFF